MHKHFITIGVPPKVRPSAIQGCTMGWVFTYISTKRQVVSKLHCRVVFLKYLSVEWNSSV